MTNDWVVKLSGNGITVLSKATGKWEPGDNSSESKALASKIQALYVQYRQKKYSPSEGYPGYQWAHRIAQHNGLQYEDKPCPPLPEGAVS